MFVAAQGSDPTRPLTGFALIGTSAQGSQKLVLEAIVHGDAIHTAVINNKKLKVGGMIGEYTLTAVNDTSVVLRSGEEKIKLSLFSSVIAK